MSEQTPEQTPEQVAEKIVEIQARVDACLDYFSTWKVEEFAVRAKSDIDWLLKQYAAEKNRADVSESVNLHFVDSAKMAREQIATLRDQLQTERDQLAAEIKRLKERRKDKTEG